MQRRKLMDFTFTKAMIKLKKVNPIKFSPIEVGNQRKFAPNPSPIRIRIPDCTLVSIFGITFSSKVQLGWFKLGWNVNLKGYNFVVCQKCKIRPVLGLRAECTESCGCGYLFGSLPWQLVLFYLSSLMFSILFLCFLSITMSN